MENPDDEGDRRTYLGYKVKDAVVTAPAPDSGITTTQETEYRRAAGFTAPDGGKVKVPALGGVAKQALRKRTCAHCARQATSKI